MDKNVFHLDFIEPKDCIKVIKECFPQSRHEEKEWSHHITLNPKDPKDKVIIYFDNSGHLTLDLNQCKTKEEFYSKLKEPLALIDNDKGKIKLPCPYTQKLYSKKLSFELKNAILENFKNKVKDTGNTPDQYFVLAIKGKNSLVHLKNGELTLQGPNPNKITDDIYSFVNNFLEKNINKHKLIFEEINIKKEEFDTFLQNNIGIDLIKNLDKTVYDYLSGRDVWEIEDGLNIYYKIKEKETKLRNYKCLVRNFSVAFEGFLIKYFLEIGYISKEAYMQDPTTVNIFKCINRFRQDYQQIIERRQKGLISKVSNLWNECRNNYLHSDLYSYSQLLNLEQAEAKIIEIFTTMKQLLEVLPLIKRRNNENAN